MNKSSQGDEKYTNLALHSGITLAGQIGGRLLGFLFLAIVTRVVRPEAYGVYTLSLSVLLVVQRFSDLNLDRAVDYFIPQALADGDIASAKSMFANLLGITVLSSSVAALVMWAGADTLGELLGEPSASSVIAFFALLLPMLAINQILASTFGSILSFGYRAITQNIIRPVVKLVATLGLLAVLDDGVSALIGGYATALVSIVIVSGFLLIWQASWIRQAKIVPVPRREMLSYSLPLLFAGIGYILVSHIDYFLLGYYLGAEEVAVYRVVFYLVANLMILNTTVNTVLKPVLAGNLTDNDLISRLYQMTTRWVTLLLIPPAMILAFSPELYLSILFTEQYVSGAATLSVLCIGVLIAAFFGPGSTTIEALGHSRLRFINSILLLGLNIVLGIAFIPHFGVLGAGIGTAVSLTVIAIVELVQVVLLRGVWPYSKSILSVWFATIPCGITVILFVQSGLNTKLLAVVIPVATVTVYLATLIWLDAFTDEDRAVIRRFEEKIGFPVISWAMS